MSDSPAQREISFSFFQETRISYARGLRVFCLLLYHRDTPGDLDSMCFLSSQPSDSDNSPLRCFREEEVRPHFQRASRSLSFAGSRPFVFPFRSCRTLSSSAPRVFLNRTTRIVFPHLAFRFASAKTPNTWHSFAQCRTRARERG